ncbi:MAG TPA: site-specific integrase [Bosea sp. (in: a-proteobacteria)]|jgi:integrase|uniref:site-specific integrase n=1 Tax=Bosea sp. (in: a-proteobacteria) TaxID=1871050 RepID=UPI002E15A8F0|nr:site-specific integrase [Bosea sp. (in: a-proteobacteria)]
MARAVSKPRKQQQVLGRTGRGEPYLWLRPGRVGTDGIERGATWLIKHGSKQLSTGCGSLESKAALAKLEEYRVSLHAPTTGKNQPASKVLIADVVSRYIDAKNASVARPQELAQRLVNILEWWGDRTLADIDSVSCGAYVTSRVGKPWKVHARKVEDASKRKRHSKPSTPRLVTEAGARRELEDLRSAVNLAIADGITREIIKVSLPDKAPERDRWLTRSEVARMLLSAWHFRETQKGAVTDRRSRRHLAKFILVALRTGTRAEAVCTASFIPEMGKPWMELKEDSDGKKIAKFHRLALGSKEAKNKKYPTVPMPDSLAAHLHRWHAKGQRYVVEFNGKPIASTKKAFANLVHDLGLEDGVVRHTLRHTAATWGMQAGADIWELSGYLGMSVEVLERRYGHHSPDHMEGARMALESRGGRKRASKNGR